jgi:hypothetical protein
VADPTAFGIPAFGAGAVPAVDPAGFGCAAAVCAAASKIPTIATLPPEASVRIKFRPFEPYPRGARAA